MSRSRGYHTTTRCTGHGIYAPLASAIAMRRRFPIVITLLTCAALKSVRFFCCMFLTIVSKDFPLPQFVLVCISGNVIVELMSEKLDSNNALKIVCWVFAMPTEKKASATENMQLR